MGRARGQLAGGQGTCICRRSGNAVGTRLRLQVIALKPVILETSLEHDTPSSSLTFAFPLHPTHVRKRVTRMSLLWFSSGGLPWTPLVELTLNATSYESHLASPMVSLLLGEVEVPRSQTTFSQTSFSQYRLPLAASFIPSPQKGISTDTSCLCAHFNLGFPSIRTTRNTRPWCNMADQDDIVRQTSFHRLF